MNRARTCLLLTLALAAVSAAPSAARQDAAALPDILISRQLAESRGLRAGDIVRLSPDRTGARARPFRVSGVYEPPPDPMRFAQQRHEARLHLPDLLGLTGNPSDPAATELVSTIQLALQNPADAGRFPRAAGAALPTIAARATNAEDDRTTTFVVVERFHLAIAV